MKYYNFFSICCRCITNYKHGFPKLCVHNVILHHISIFIVSSNFERPRAEDIYA